MNLSKLATRADQEMITNTGIIYLKGSTSNNASASTIIREILARLLDSSAVKNESHEHVPSRWSPDAQSVVCWPPSLRSPITLSET